MIRDSNNGLKVVAALVITFIFTAPILVALLAVLMLKERVAAWRWVLTSRQRSAGASPALISAG